MSLEKLLSSSLILLLLNAGVEAKPRKERSLEYLCLERSLLKQEKLIKDKGRFIWEKADYIKTGYSDIFLISNKSDTDQRYIKRIGPLLTINKSFYKVGELKKMDNVLYHLATTHEKDICFVNLETQKEEKTKYPWISELKKEGSLVYFIAITEKNNFCHVEFDLKNFEMKQELTGDHYYLSDFIKVDTQLGERFYYFVGDQKNGYTSIVDHQTKKKHISLINLINGSPKETRMDLYYGLKNHFSSFILNK
jgi:hypothetical protein